MRQGRGIRRWRALGPGAAFLVWLCGLAGTGKAWGLEASVAWASPPPATVPYGQPIRLTVTVSVSPEYGPVALAVWSRRSDDPYWFTLQKEAFTVPVTGDGTYSHDHMPRFSAETLLVHLYATSLPPIELGWTPEISFTRVWTIPPTITSLDPVQGPNSGGTIVSIYGAGFVSGATVNFGALSATSVSWLAASTLTCMAPPQAAGRVDVTVTNPDGLAATLHQGFEYTPARRCSLRFAERARLRPVPDGVGGVAAVYFSNFRITATLSLEDVDIGAFNGSTSFRLDLSDSSLVLLGDDGSIGFSLGADERYSPGNTWCHLARWHGLVGRLIVHLVWDASSLTATVSGYRLADQAGARGWSLYSEQVLEGALSLSGGVPSVDLTGDDATVRSARISFGPADSGVVPVVCGAVMQSRVRGIAGVEGTYYQTQFTTVGATPRAPTPATGRASRRSDSGAP